MRDDGTVYGDGVNVAARLEGLAEPGGIMLADDAQRYAKGKVSVGFAEAGSHEVKNIAEPVRAWRVVGGGELPTVPAKAQRRKHAWIGVAAAAVIAIVAIWQLAPRIDDQPADEAESASVSDNPILAMPSGPSIAVLPLENLGQDASWSYVADGLTSDIITRLTKFSELDFLVFAQSTMFQYRGQPADARAVAAELGADYVVEGSVRADDSTIRVAVQLLNGETGASLWAENFDRAMEAGSIIALQDELSHSIAARIAGPYGEIVMTDIAEARTSEISNVGVFQCNWLQTAYDLNMEKEQLDRVRDCVIPALEESGEDARLWAAMAFLHDETVMRGYATDDTFSFEKGREAAEKAVALDPEYAQAQLSLALSCFRVGDVACAKHHIEIATTLAPSNTVVMGVAAMIHANLANFRLGYDIMAKVKRIDPRHPPWMNWQLFWYPFVEREFAEAAVHLDNVNDEWHWV
ncbi:MAG: hypothetical protein QGF53_10245, partial [Alphaproteobacteria bacterium]|nr:hypothetical protein [Alphaproteobacteria bacterium]